jgi:hypothetical protein
MVTISGIHVVIILLVISGRRRGLLFLQQFFAIKRARRVQLEPRAYAVEIKAVIVVTWKLNHKWIFVYACLGQLCSFLM